LIECWSRPSSLLKLILSWQKSVYSVFILLISLMSLAKLSKEDLTLFNSSKSKSKLVCWSELLIRIEESCSESWVTRRSSGTRVIIVRPEYRVFRVSPGVTESYRRATRISRPILWSKYRL
jgi:hypothetical protein